MNIERQNIDDLTSVLKVKVEKNDYEPRVKKVLNDYRRKAEIKGFRAGMVPMSLIQKMYGHSVMLEEINKLISESLGKYIEDEKLDLIGEAIPSETEQKPIDWENDTDFEFAYEIGVVAPLEIELNKRVQIPYYKITVSNEDKEKQLDYILRRYGQLADAETSEAEDTLTVDFNQEGENAHTVEDTHIWLQSITDENIKKEFVGLKVGDTKAVDVKAVFTNEIDLAAMLHLKKEDLEQLNPDFIMTVKEIKHLQKAELNHELFDKVYGESNVKNEVEFMQRIEDEITKHYAAESNIRFGVDARRVLLKKAAIQLPEDFLKRWLIVVGKDKYTQEDIEREFDIFTDNLRWQRIMAYLAKQQDIKINTEDIQHEALHVAHERFVQYGLNYLSDEHLMGYVGKMMEDREEVNRIGERVLQNRVLEYVRGQVKLNEKEITFDGLQKLYENDSEPAKNGK